MRKRATQEEQVQRPKRDADALSTVEEKNEEEGLNEVQRQHLRSLMNGHSYGYRARSQEAPWAAIQKHSNAYICGAHSFAKAG